MASGEQRQQNLAAILRWSLQQDQQQHAEGTAPTQMDPERRCWLEGALESAMSAPSETEVLKAALGTLKAHGDTIPATMGTWEVKSLSKDEFEDLEKSFSQIQYLIEDLDHAKDLIPLDGVDIIIKYLHHCNSDLLQSACDLIATATQNNPKCQQVFLQALPRLLSVVENSSLPSGTRVKALYAVSCLTREFEPGLQELLRQDGLSVLLRCLRSEVQKMVVKTLFIVMSYYSTGKQEGPLLERIDVLVGELVALLRSCRNNEILGHTLSTLSTLVSNQPHAVLECQKPEYGLEEVLKTMLKELQQPECEDDWENIEQILRKCFNR